MDDAPMKERELQRELDRLRAEVNRATGKDAVARERLNTLISDIENHVAGSARTGSDRADLASRIRQAIEQFETHHPRATAILNEIMVALGNMGI